MAARHKNAQCNQGSSRGVSLRPGGGANRRRAEPCALRRARGTTPRTQTPTPPATVDLKALSSAAPFDHSIPLSFEVRIPAPMTRKEPRTKFQSAVRLADG